MCHFVKNVSATYTKNIRKRCEWQKSIGDGQYSAVNWLKIRGFKELMCVWKNLINESKVGVCRPVKRVLLR